MSATIDASKLLQPGLLDGVRVLVAAADGLAPAGGAGHDRHELIADAVASVCAELGADVSRWQAGAECAADVDLLVIDGGGLFAAPGRGEREGDGARLALAACLDGAWQATLAVANAAFIDPGRGGRVIYLAPASSGRSAEHALHADAARAGLENLARTLSIEWARYAVTLVAVAPGTHTAAAELAMIAAFLGSPAGAYYSGCQFDLRGPAGAALDTMSSAAR